jgi:transporter family-2 protein
VDKGLAVGLTAFAGGLVALQAPINSGLGRSVGTFGAASMSFAIGTVVLVAIAAVTGGWDFSHIGDLSWYYFIGGLLGAVYVTSVLVTVRTLGAGGVTAATISGQLAMSVVIDRLGLFGLEQKPISVGRVIGVALLAAGVFLIVRE